MSFLSLLCRTLQVSRVSWLLLYFISSTNTSFDTLNFSSASRTTSPSRSSNPAAANGSSRPPSVTPYSLSIRPTSIPSNWRNPRNNSSSNACSPVTVSSCSSGNRPLSIARTYAAASCAFAQRCLPENRSEEHTSELQSRSDLVCRLLLEK